MGSLSALILFALVNAGLAFWACLLCLEEIAQARRNRFLCVLDCLALICIVLFLLDSIANGETSALYGFASGIAAVI